MVVVSTEMEEQRGDLANGSQAVVALHEFDEWLEQRLDSFGADAHLYLRCVQSILRQSRDDDGDDTRRLTGTRTALIELLRTIDGREDPLVIATFVTEIMERFHRLLSSSSSCLVASLDYVEEAAAQRQAYDSIDSGVCPSPAESLQNYDQAFPPLANCDGATSFLFPNDLLELQLQASPPYSQYAAHRSAASSVSSSASSSAKRKKRETPEGIARKIARSLPTATTAFWADPLAQPKMMGGGFSLWSATQPLFVVPRQVRAVAPCRPSPTAAVMAGSDVPFWPPLPPPSPVVQPAGVADGDVQRWLTAAAEFCSVNATTHVDALETGTLAEEEWFDAPRFALHIIGSDEERQSPRAYAMWSAAGEERKATSGVEFCLPKVAKARSEDGEVTEYVIPIAPTTHFVPIRSESMEDAYFPRPGFDEAVKGDKREANVAAVHGEPLLRFRTTNKTVDVAIQTCQQDEQDGEVDVLAPTTPTQFALDDDATLGDVWTVPAASEPGAALLLWEQTTAQPCGELMEDDASYEEQLLRYVSSISLMAPLVDDAPTDGAACGEKGAVPHEGDERFVVAVSPSLADAADEPIAFRC